MLKTEFCYLIDCETKSLSENDYAAIEFVYNHYPKDLNKSDIATLYQVGGMSVIKDMQKTAERAKDINTNIRELNTEIEKLSNELKLLADGEDKF